MYVRHTISFQLFCLEIFFVYLNDIQGFIGTCVYVCMCCRTLVYCFFLFKLKEQNSVFCFVFFSSIFRACFLIQSDGGGLIFFAGRVVNTEGCWFILFVFLFSFFCFLCLQIICALFCFCFEYSSLNLYKQAIEHICCGVVFFFLFLFLFLLLLPVFLITHSLGALFVFMSVL